MNLAKKYSCSECGYAFTRKWSTERHITNKHQDVERAVPLINSVSAGLNTTVADTSADIEVRSAILFAEEYLRQTAKRLADLAFESAAKEEKLEKSILLAIGMYQDAREKRLDLSRILEYRHDQ